MINKTYSKTYSDQTKFYTSDTALELNFQLKEVEYDFDSAEIILLNVDDRSLVTRPVGKNADGFTYELEDDIVAHYGEWKGQLKFNEGGEIYVSSPVSFRIENDLTNDRPPQLTEVNTWKNLREIADGLIADIRSELESVAEQLSEIEGAETTRQQAETQRTSAESSRVIAEEQRKIDHANRSAELASKADKVVLVNLIENGDFSEGTDGIATGFKPMDSTTNPRLVDGVQYWTGSTTGYAGSLRAHPIYLNSGDIYYISVVTSNVAIIYANELLVDTRNVDGLHSSTFALTSDFTNITFRVRTINQESSVSNVQLINLTQIFGAGNEPTKEEMDELIKITGYIDGEYALNNKEMLGHLMKGIREKADKKQEDWITPTLRSGATAKEGYPVGYMKDEMGFVHFRGKLILPSYGTKVLYLPVGYRPASTIDFLCYVEPNKFGRVSVQWAGDVYPLFPYNANTEYDLSSITFKADN